MDTPPPDTAPDEERVTASVTDLDAMTAACAGVDAVIHLAAIADEAPWERIAAVNIEGTYVAFEAARRAGVRRVIYASSNHAVGFAPRSEFPVPDYAFPAPDTYYGVAKVTGEALAALYHHRYGMDAICLRILTCAEKPPERSVAVHLAFPRRRRAAVRGLPDRGRPGLPGGLRGVGEHPGRVGEPGRGPGAGVRAPGRRGGPMPPRSSPSTGSPTPPTRCSLSSAASTPSRPTMPIT